MDAKGNVPGYLARYFVIFPPPVKTSSAVRANDCRYNFQQDAALWQDNLKNPRIFLARECNEMRVAHGV